MLRFYADRHLRHLGRLARLTVVSPVRETRRAGHRWEIDNSVIVLHPCWHAPARVTFTGHA